MNTYPPHLSATSDPQPESPSSCGESDRRDDRGHDNPRDNLPRIPQPPHLRLLPIEPSVTLGHDEMALRMLPALPGLVFRSVIPQNRPHNGHDGTDDELETRGAQPPATDRNACGVESNLASPTPSDSSPQSCEKPPPQKTSRNKTPAKRRANEATSIENSTNRSLPPRPRPRQQERQAIMVQFEEVKAHTAKCDDCDHRNTNGMSRCKLCGWQCCRKCQSIRGGDKTHETVRGPHVPIAENLEAQASPSFVGTVSRLVNAGRPSSAFADVGRIRLTAHMDADRAPAAAEQDAASALMRMGSPSPTQSIGRFNAESPVPPSISRFVRNDDDDDYDRALKDSSDVETVGGDSTITWDSDLDENNEQLEPILEPLGLCRRNPPRASRPADMRD